METAHRQDANILAVLAERARASSDTRLLADAALGLLAAIALAWWRGPAWYFLFAMAVCFCTFGVWGICDRELREPRNATRAQRTLLATARAAAGIAGVLSAVFLIMVVLAKALGTIIS